VRRLALIPFAVALVACRSSSPTASLSTLDISGNWSGTLTNAANRLPTPLSFTVEQGGLVYLQPSPGPDPNQVLAGTYSLDTDLAVIIGGSVSGVINKSTVSLALNKSPSNGCVILVTATMTGANSMRGNYTWCPASDSGSFSATRR